MKPFSLILFLLFSSLFFNVCSAQPLPISWQYLYGGLQDDGGTCIRQCPDGGYVFCGGTKSDDGFMQIHGSHGGLGDIWVVRINVGGDTVWTKCLGGSNSDLVLGSECLQLSPDGGFVLAGNTWSLDGDVSGNHSDTGDAWAVKLDQGGNLLWQKCIGGMRTDQFYAVQTTADGGYLFAGNTKSSDGDINDNHGEADILLVKMSSAGNVEWHKCIGGSQYDGATSMIKTSDGNFLIMGSTLSTDGDATGLAGYTSIWLIKIDQGGAIQWSKGMTCNITGSGNYIIEDPGSNGYVIAATNIDTLGDFASLSRKYDYVLMWTDSGGNMTRVKNYGGSRDDIIQGIVAGKEGGYLMAGLSLSLDGDVAAHYGLLTYYDAWIIKVNDTGTLEWQKTLGGAKQDYMASIAATSDSGYVLCGNTYSIDGDLDNVMAHNAAPSYSDVWVVKLGQHGAEAPIIKTTGNNIKVYPTLCNGVLTIESSSKDIPKLRLNDMMGREVPFTINKTRPIQIHFEDAPEGIYMMQVDGRIFKIYNCNF